MQDRIRKAQDDAVTAYVTRITRAISGMAGDIDQVNNYFTDKYNRHAAQAVLQLIAHIEPIKQRARSKERSNMLRENGFG